MKTLVELSVPVTGWNGRPLEKDLIGKELLLTYCSMFVSTNKADIFMAINVGQKIFNCKENTLVLEDAEFAFLEKTIAEPKHTALAMMHVYKMMGTKIE